MTSISTRPYHEPTDRNFILATWLKGLYFGNAQLRQFDMHLFFKMYNDRLIELLLHPTTAIIIGCLNDDKDVIIGYCVYTADCVHWVFVKESFRMMGVANQITPSHIKTYSHSSHQGYKLAMNHQLRFTPLWGDHES